MPFCHVVSFVNNRIHGFMQYVVQLASQQ